MKTVPDVGEIWWASLDGAIGTEQQGRRPVMVISEASLHGLTGRAIVCPVTSRPRGWPTEIALPAPVRTRGVVLADQVRCIDIEHRLRRFVEPAPRQVLDEVLFRLARILGITPIR